MATTDKSEWILLDTDLTTRLSIMPVGDNSHLYFEINEPGSGEIKIPLDSIAAGLITAGMFCECYYRGSSRGGFFVDNLKEAQVDASEAGGRWLSISGRGPLALLDDAIVWDDGTTSTSREFTSVTKASILITLITEAKARGALANLTYDFSATDDTASTAWTDSEQYKLTVGTSLLDVARQFAVTGGFDFEINLVAGDFVLSAYAAGLGTSKAETIFLRSGTNCEEVSADERANDLRNATRVKYKSGYLTVSDGTSITAYRRRESLLSLEQAQSSSSASTYAAARLANTKDPKRSIAVRVYDGIKPNLFLDYDMGDYLTLDVRGSESVYRVLGIQADFDGTDYSNVVLELNTILYDSQMDMEQDLEWLLDQWNTANDANEVEVSFWAPLGTRSATGIKDMLIYNGYLYVCGLGNMGAGGYPGVARYEIATGIWSGMGTSFIVTDELTALVVEGGEIYVSAVRVSPTNIVYKWNGSSWDEYFQASGQAGAKVIQMLEGDTSNILLCGSGFSDLAAPAYRYVSGIDLVGTDRYALTFWAGAGTCQCIAFYGSTLHAGWISAAGYTGFMKTIPLAPARDGCVLEFSPIVIAELEDRYATKLLEFGSDLLVAYADIATGIAYLGQWNGATFTVLGTFTNAAPDAKITSITTYLTDIYVGGNFTAVDGTAMARVAKYSGGAWSPLTNGVGSGAVVASALDDLDFYVAGTFNDVDGGLKPADGLGIYFTDFEKALDFASHNMSVNWGSIGSTLADQADLQAALDAKTSLAFKTLAVSGQSNIVADAKDDTLTLVAGTGITLTTNAGTDALTITASGTGDISGTGVVGQVAEFVTDTKTLQAAKIIGPAVNILTLTNAAASTLALNITAAKTLTLTSADNYNLTIPATGTAALLATANVFTAAQTITPATDVVGLVINKSTTADALQIKTGATVLSRFNNFGELYYGTASRDTVLIPPIYISVNTPSASSYMAGIEAVMDVSGKSSLGAYGMYFQGYVRPGAGFTVSEHYAIIAGQAMLGTGGDTTRCAVIDGRMTISGTGIFRNVAFYNIDTFSMSGTPIVTNLYYLNFPGISKSGGTIANHYGIFLGDVSSGGTINYAIQTGKGLIVHGDKMTITGWQDVQQLVVTGHTTQAVATPLVQFTRNDAAAGVSSILRLTALGSLANGDGGSLELRGKSSTTADTAMGMISYSWVDVTHLSRKADVILSAYDTAVREGIRIRADGTRSLVGIGTAAPTARLHLPAGGTAANTAPLKFTTQATALTSVEQGTMELVGNSLQFTQLAKRRGVVMSQSTMTADFTLVSSAAESATIITAEHGANYLEVGKMEEIRLYGTLQKNVGTPTNTLTIRTKYAGATIHTIVSSNAAIAANTQVEIIITITCRTTGATGTLQINSIVRIDGDIITPAAPSLVTVNTTAAEDTTVTAQFTNSSATNNLVIHQGRVLCIEPNR